MFKEDLEKLINWIIKLVIYSFVLAVSFSLKDPYIKGLVISFELLIGFITFILPLVDKWYDIGIYEMYH
ncbi:hypothetical protein [Brassicibacter mesophilus]|uniref:hypothetical protein n=1 Tax=Brassicibacter mesophilus TaxID=745119 RepID=UPI003D1CE958